MKFLIYTLLVIAALILIISIAAIIGFNIFDELGYKIVEFIVRII